MEAIQWDVVAMPEWAVCYLEYGDEGDLSREDCELADEWQTSLMGQVNTEYGLRSSVTFEYGEERYFDNNPAFGLPADCVDCTITVLR